MRAMTWSARRILTVVGLVCAWCALWGNVSAANILSGAVLAALALGLGVGTRASGGLRLVPFLTFGGLVAIDLVMSTVNVAREILTPTDYTDESIVAVQLQADGRRHLLLLVIAVTVTPGTAVVDTDPDTGTLYLHVLHHDRSEATIAHVGRLSQLACAAFPVAESSEGASA